MNFENPEPPEAPEPPEVFDADHEDIEATFSEAIRHVDPLLVRGHSKTVTIRGVDKDIYTNFTRKLSESDMKVGDAITLMMNSVLADFDQNFPHLSSRSLESLVPLKRVKITEHETLNITETDLVESNVRVSFYRIGELIFDKSVTKESFMKFVRTVENCEVVKVPKVLPKLVMLSKLNRVEKIEFTE